MYKNIENKLYAMMMFTVLLSSLMLIGVLVNRSEIDQFKDRGDRFTYCDGLLLYRETVDPSLPEDELCVNETRFNEFLNNAEQEWYN